MVPPTVPPGGERVRICLRADLGVEPIKRLVNDLGEWVNQEMKGPLGTAMSEEVIYRSKL